MTKQAFAISLQSVDHIDRGNGIVAALKRGFGHGYGLQPTCIVIGGMVSMLSGMALRISSDLLSVALSLFGQAPFGQALFGRDKLDGHQLANAAALRQASGRYSNGITTVLIQH